MKGFKGRPKGTPKTGGRVKGTPNKRTVLLRRMVLQRLALEADVTAEQIRRGLLFDVRSLLDKDGNLRPIRELSEAEAMPIAGIEVVKRNITAGDGAVDTVIKVKLADRAKYVELAAKYLGMLIDRHQHDVKVTLEDLVAGSMDGGK